MKSIDTHVLFYGTNADCPEHAWARPILEEMLAEPGAWVLADQVLLEYYRLVRSSAVLERPLSGPEAAERLGFFRERAGCLHCGYEPSLWPAVLEVLQREDFPPGHTFDAVLAVTLRAAGVKRLVTRNTKDFAALGFFEVVNPERGVT